MPEFSGLQIDPRCIKCGQPPTADVPLYEMQNHLSICDSCRQDEEQKGKQIAWVGGIQMEKMPPQVTKQLIKTQNQTNTENIPKNSLFGILGVPTSASRSEIEKGIGEKMRYWMREPNSDEKAQIIEQLRTWQEELVSNPQFLQTQLDRLQPIKLKSKGGFLLLGNQSIYTAQELLNACEEDEQAWLQAEELLKDGVLEPWINYQLGNRIIANEARRLTKENIPTFRALNILLYRLMPERPFRFYSNERWQALTNVPNAVTPGELALICDQDWEKAEYHLYQGAIIDWLEYTHGSKGLSQYYNAGIKPYEKDRLNRGLGLELILERCVPRLTHPKLVATFDGEKDEYILEAWDREIPHQAVTFQLTNTTRGYTSITLEIVQPPQQVSIIEPDWIYLADSHPTTPVHIHGRPESTTGANRKIVLSNLEQLARGKRYERRLRLIERREYDRPPLIHDYPLVIKTLSYFQGFRSILWRWGLRGDIPGFIWNAIAGGILALVSLRLLLLNIHTATYLAWYREASQNLTIGNAFLVSLAGAMSDLVRLPGNVFVLGTAIIAGIPGFFTGIGKGHTSYTEKISAHSFRKGVNILLLICFFMLLYLFQGYTTLNTVLQSAGNQNVVIALFVDGGVIIFCLLLWFILLILVVIRGIAEKYLRVRYTALLSPEGKE